MRNNRVVALRSFLFLLIAIGAMISPQAAKGDSITITTPGLLGDSDIPCDGSATFRLVLRGTGTPGTTFTLTFGVFGVNPGEIVERQLNPFNMVEVTVGENGLWAKDIVFLLRCVGCDFVQGFNPVKVDSGSIIFGRIQVPGQTVDTNSITVHCVTPEPTSMVLLSIGLAGVALKMRKRVRSRKSGKGS